MGDLLEIIDSKTDQPEIELKRNNQHNSIDLNQLINRLNYINFQDGTLTSVFHHKNYNRSISLNMKPKACIDSQLSCLWPERADLQEEIKNYNLKEIYIDDGINTIVINPEDVNLEQEGFTIHLPDINEFKPSRKTRRLCAKNTQVQMVQNGVLYRGKLINFTPGSFEIEIQSGVNPASGILNSDVPITVTLLNDGQIKFSGESTIIRISKGGNFTSCVLAPIYNHIQRFKAKEYRSVRQKLIPSPNIVFIHPFTGARVDLPIYDLSGAGFSVEEDQRNSTLLPGMIISELEIVFTTGMAVKCKCQVLYKKTIDEDSRKKHVLNGFTILDMTPYDHAQLLSIIFLAKNKNLHLSKDLDSDSFWRFLFDSGFIYPAKYAHLKNHKEKIKSTYKKIYTNTPDIARHVTYQEKGEILGHASMLRSYEKTWLIHHHAASHHANMGAGLYVMDQLASYAYNAHKIQSLQLDYLLGYFRPQNKFPVRVFGGSAKSIADPQKCSVDEVAFLKFHANVESVFDDLGPYRLVESSNEDLLNLESYYEEISGGLMLKALDILPFNSGNTGVIKAYEKLQFKREMKLYSLKTDSELMAVFIVDKTDTGMNMSELTNNIKVIVVQPDNLPIKILESGINEIVKLYFEKSAHLLLFPDTYADKNSMVYEKKYNMWILNVEDSDGFYKYLKKMLRFVKT